MIGYIILIRIVGNASVCVTQGWSFCQLVDLTQSVSPLTQV